MQRVLVLTDSTSDIPPAWAQRLGIHVVPVYVHFGLESLRDDGIELSRDTFYQRLTTDPQHPTTSAPSPGEFETALTEMLAGADHVIGITAPARLSGIYNALRIAAERVAPDRVTLVDSQSLSMGLGWQAIIAAEMVQAGHDPAAVKAHLTGMHDRILVWAALDTLDYLRRSGRVSWARAMLGTLFNIKPIVRVQYSAVESASRVRTTRRALEQMIEYAHQAAPVERLAVMHTRNLAGAQRLVAALSDIHPSTEIAIVEATPVLGVHVGPYGLGLAVVKQVSD